MHHRDKFRAFRSTIVEIWPFVIFQNGGRTPFWISESSNFQLPVRRSNMRHRAKFRADQSSRCRDTADFRCFKFKMEAFRHLAFVLRLVGPPSKSIW